MAIYEELLNFDADFDRLSKPPIIVNDLVGSSEEERELIKKTIFTYYESDTMSTVPSCDCGDVIGVYNVGVKCSNCFTECKLTADQTLESTLWMRAPHGVAKLINPVIWGMLNDHFKISGFELVRWIADSSYRPDVKTPKEFKIIEQNNIQRGYNYFVENFDNILDVLFSIKAVSKKKSNDALIRLIKENRTIIFSKHIPLPNRSILIVEGTSTSKYVDPLVVGAINAIQIITSVDSGVNEESFKPLYFNEEEEKAAKKTVDDLSMRGRENRTIKAIHELSSFYTKYYSAAVAGKKGLYRKQIFGTRSHFSFRAVISSITNKHRYTDIYIPWSVALAVFRIHLLNKLTKRGFNTNEAISKLNSAVQHYDELIDVLFDELINESPSKSIPCILQRNPSLERGSAQLVGITKIKKSMNDPTISMSILIVRGMNADFDGDALNVTLCVDNYMAKELDDLAPHKSTFDLNKPYNVSANLSMPKTVVSTFSSWLAEPIDTDSLDKNKVSETLAALEAF